MNQRLFEGIMPPLSTFFDDEGNFDPKAQGEAIDRVIEAGVQGILVLGSAGEFFSMTVAERKKIAEFCIKHAAGRVKVLVGTGSCSLSETIELTEHAGKAGADGVLVINPYYSPMSRECLRRHYLTIADASPIPVLVYNFPAMTKQDIPADLIIELAKSHPNIVGLKDSVTDVAHTRAVILATNEVRPDFCVFSGFDEHILNNLALGGVGGIPGTANFAPEVTVGLYNAFKAGDYQKAFAFHRRAAALSAVYGIETPYFGTLKEAAKLVGLKVGSAVLPPTLPLSPEGYAKLKALFEENGL